MKNNQFDRGMAYFS